MTHFLLPMCCSDPPVVKLNWWPPHDEYKPSGTPSVTAATGCTHFPLLVWIQLPLSNLNSTLIGVWNNLNFFNFGETFVYKEWSGSCRACVLVAWYIAAIASNCTVLKQKLYATCTSPIMHLICHAKFCISIVFNSLRGRRLEVFGRKKERARERETREGRGSACARGPIDLAQTNRTAKKRCTFISSVLIYLL